MIISLGLTFEVIEGGFLDIDIKVKGPDQDIMHQSEKESSSRLTFAAVKTGAYTVCFDNQKSSMTPKLVMFSIDVGESPHRAPGVPGEEEIGHTKLEDMIRELSATLTSVKHEQEYMHVRQLNFFLVVQRLFLMCFFRLIFRCVTRFIVLLMKVPTLVLSCGLHLKL